MITEILPITETKIAILSYLYTFGELNLAEISKKLTITPSNILKTLPKLTSILVIRKVGNIKLYSLDNLYIKKLEPLIEEYRLSKTFGIHSQLLYRIENITGIEHLFVFGSFAKEENSEDSDLDLIIITNTKEKVIKEIKVLQKIAPYSIEPMYLNLKEYEEELKNTNSRFKKIIEDKSQRIKVK